MAKDESPREAIIRAQMSGIVHRIGSMLNDRVNSPKRLEDRVDVIILGANKLDELVEQLEKVREEIVKFARPDAKEYAEQMRELHRFLEDNRIELRPFEDYPLPSLDVAKKMAVSTATRLVYNGRAWERAGQIGMRDGKLNTVWNETHLQPGKER